MASTKILYLSVSVTIKWRINGNGHGHSNAYDHSNGKAKGKENGRGNSNWSDDQTSITLKFSTTRYGSVTLTVKSLRVSFCHF